MKNHQFHWRMLCFVSCFTMATLGHAFAPSSSSVLLLHQQAARFVTIVHFAVQNTGNNDDNNEDFEGMIIGDYEYNNVAGQELAIEFSRELQARKEQQQQQANNNSEDATSRRLLSKDEVRFLNRKAFVASSSSSSPSAGFFTGQGQSVYSFPLDASGSVSPTAATRRGASSSSSLSEFPTVSPLFLPTIMAIAILSVYLTFATTGDSAGMTTTLSETAATASSVEDWNAALIQQDVASIEKVVVVGSGSSSATTSAVSAPSIFL